MNIRQKIVSTIKKHPEATIVDLASAAELDKNIVRYHIKAMEKEGWLEVGEGKPGRGGSPTVTAVDLDAAAEAAKTWKGRGEGAGEAPKAAKAPKARAAAAPAPAKRRGRPRKATSVPETNGTYVVTYVGGPQNGEITCAEVFLEQEKAVTFALEKGGQLFSARALNIIHTVAPVEA